MKRKYVIGAVAVFLVAGGLWITRGPARAPENEKSHAKAALATSRSGDVDSGRAASASKASPTGSAATADYRPKEGRQHRPPDPTRKFREYTPEERVKFARRGYGPGG